MVDEMLPIEVIMAILNLKMAAKIIVLNCYLFFKWMCMVWGLWVARLILYLDYVWKTSFS